MTDTEVTEEKDPFDRLTTKTAFVVMLCGVAVFFSIPNPAMGRAAAISITMIVTAVWMRWDLRKRIWFWATIAVLVLLHVPFILLVPWSNVNYPGVVLLPQALLELAVAYGCVKVVERAMKRSDKTAP
jgi:hypothetical protein